VELPGNGCSRERVGDVVRPFVLVLEHDHVKA
jgi:hypothetical protein